MEHIPYTLFSVPQRRKEHIADGVIPLFVCDYINGGHHLFFCGDTVGPVHIEPNVIDVRIRQRTVLVPRPAKISCYMDPAAHLIKVNGVVQLRIVLKDRYVIL